VPVTEDAQMKDSQFRGPRQLGIYMRQRKVKNGSPNATLHVVEDAAVEVAGVG